MSVTFRVAWRNIWRNPRRTILTVGAIAFACLLLIFSVSFQYSSYDAMIDAAIQIETGYMQIQHPQFNEEKKIYQVIPRPKEIGSILNSINGIDSFTSRGQAFALVSSETRTNYAAITGIDPEKEKKMSKISKVMKEGSYLSPEDTNQVIIGELMAKNLATKIGDELVFMGQGRDGSIAADSLTIKGIFRTGEAEFDRLVIQMPLKRFQETFFMQGAVHSIVVNGKKLQAVPQLVQSIQNHLLPINGDKKLGVYSWKELMPGLEQMLKIDQVSAWISYVILIVVVAFSIMNTFYMGIFERTREFGMLLALGMKQRHIAQLVLLESALMTLFGIFLGIILGCGVTYYFQIHGISLGAEILAQFGMPSKLMPHLSLFSVLFSPLIIFIFTMLTAIVPICKIFRIHPCEAMRTV